MSEVTEKARILVVDDEEAMRLFLKRSLSRLHHDVTTAEDGEAALARLDEMDFDLVVTDLAMPGIGGLDLLERARAKRPGLPVIVMTGYASIPSAIEALKKGAEDYVTKPFDAAEIARSVSAALEGSRLRAENRLMRRLLDEERCFDRMIGSSKPMVDMYRRIEQVAPRDGVVLVLGESGVGKELVARSLHRHGRRKDGPFVAFHAGGLPGGLVGSELFGASAGAFTGSARDRMGAAERAQGGTLFLDEVGEIPLDVQPALLRFLETFEVTPLGASETRTLDLRIVAATHRNLAELVDEGRFRRDLWYRLNVFTLEVPPLRRRRGDVPDLVRHALALIGADAVEVDLDAMALMEAWSWPGNVRELENAVRQAVAKGDGRRLTADDLPDEIRNGRSIADATDEGAPLKDAVAAFERGYLERLLRTVEGNVSEAARRAGISRPTLHAKITQYRLDPARFRR